MGSCRAASHTRLSARLVLLLCLGPKMFDVEREGSIAALVSILATPAPATAAS